MARDVVGDGTPREPWILLWRYSPAGGAGGPPGIVGPALLRLWAAAGTLVFEAHE